MVMNPSMVSATPNGMSNSLMMPAATSGLRISGGNQSASGPRMSLTTMVSPRRYIALSISIVSGGMLSPKESGSSGPYSPATGRLSLLSSLTSNTQTASTFS